MNLHTNLHAPRTTLSGRIQIGQMVLLFIITYYLFSANIKPPSIALALALPGVGNVHLKVKIKPLLSRFHHYNIPASLDK